MTALEFLQAYLDERELLEKAATEGPWDFDTNMGSCNGGAQTMIAVEKIPSPDVRPQIRYRGDANFITHARNMHAAETEVLKYLIWSLSMKPDALWKKQTLEAAAKALGWKGAK